MEYRQMNKVLILERNADTYAAEIRRHQPVAMQLHTATSPQEAQPFAEEVNIILGRPAFVAELLPATHRLDWVQSTFAGVEQLCIPGLRSDYTLTGVKGVFGPLMSEYVMAYILAIERHLFETRALQASHTWGEFSQRSLTELTIGIAGLGSIGKHIASTAAHFGMRVLGLKRSPGEPYPAESLFLPTHLDQFLSELDYLVITLPDTPQTRHMINSVSLSRMKKTAVLINVGRGATVDETALVHALQAGQIKAAVLDVFETEPLPQDSPLWEMPNVIVTPHNSAVSFPRQIAGLFCDNYQRFLEKKPLRYVVDFKRGY